MNLAAALERLNTLTANGDLVQIGVQLDGASVPMGDEWHTAADAEVAIRATHGVAADCGKEATFTVRAWAEEVAARGAAEEARSAADQAERAAHWAAKEAEWAAQGMRSCGRCGGAGGSQAWPGYVCYGCQGKGCVPA